MTKKKTIYIYSCSDCPWAWLTWEALLYYIPEYSYLAVQSEEHLYEPYHWMHDIQYVWKPFILDSTVSYEGENLINTAKKVWNQTNPNIEEVNNYVNAPLMKKLCKEVGYAEWINRTYRYNTNNIHFLLTYARSKNKAIPLLMSGYRQYFRANIEENKNTDNIKVLETITQKANFPLDAVTIEQIVQTPQWNNQFKDDVREYMQLGIHATPTLYNPENGKTFSSALSKQMIPQALERILSD